MDHELISKEAKKMARKEGSSFKGGGLSRYNDEPYLVLHSEDNEFMIGFSKKYKYKEIGFIEIYEKSENEIIKALNLRFEIGAVTGSWEDIVEEINGVEFKYFVSASDGVVHSIIIKNYNILLKSKNKNDTSYIENDLGDGNKNSLKNDNKNVDWGFDLDAMRKIKIDSEINYRLKMSDRSKNRSDISEENLIKFYGVNFSQLKAWNDADQPTINLEELMDKFK